MRRIVWVKTFIFLSLMSIVNVADACTGITLKTKSGQTIVARTIEWAGSALNSEYVVVPRRYNQQSYLPGMKQEGMQFCSKYGYVGLSVESHEFVVEGLNEKGLSVGLFYFPHYGSYPQVLDKNKPFTISDLQFVSWLLGQCADVSEVKEALKDIHICAVDPRASTVHWRVADRNGNQIVIEVVDGKVFVYDNPVGVLTNSPGFSWHMTNLANYINLSAGTTQTKTINEMKVNSIGSGSNMLGLPGDFTPPSRFIRAALFATSAPVLSDSHSTILEAFHILNNFDIPIGAQFANASQIPDIPSATQWTTATDLSGLKIYYRTMYNSHIRMIDLNKINFSTVHYRSIPLDIKKVEPIEEIPIK